MGRKTVKFPQRGKIRGRINEDVIVHGVARHDGIRIYDVEFKDGMRVEWMPSRVELLGPVEESTG